MSQNHLVLADEQLAVLEIHIRDNFQALIQVVIGVGEDLQSEVLTMYLIKERHIFVHYIYR